MRLCCGLIFCVEAVATALAQEPSPPAKAIQDNSFLVEEAYNQEEGVVQHILTAQFSHGQGQREWDLLFTQEWPLFSQLHQISYTIPYSFLSGEGDRRNGFGDVEFHYRYQALFETDRIPAFTPELTMIVPTGDANKGLGNDTVGWEVLLPFSKVLNDRWTVHANAGATLFPDVHSHDLYNYDLGGSAIYAITRDLNLMLECVANFDEDVTRHGGTERTSSVLLSPGFRYAWNFPAFHEAQMVVGVAAPIGVTHDAPDWGLFFYFSFEHSFLRKEKKEISTK